MLLWLLLVLLGHFPSAFSAWDTVVSWNRWALDWYDGRLPRHTYGYPQLIPPSWSTGYLWLGSSRIDIFAKAFMGLFTIGIVILFFDLYWRFRQFASLLAAMLWCLLVVKVFPDLMDSGYVDIGVTFFIAVTAHLMVLIHPLLDSMRIYFIFLRFFASSLLAAGVDLAAFAITISMGGPLILGMVVGRATAIGINFLVNSRFVFKKTGQRWVLLRYLLVVVVLMALSYLLIRELQAHTSASPVLAKVIAESGLFLISFAIQRAFVFGKWKRNHAV